jgi:hypothetical protein
MGVFYLPKDSGAVPRLLIEPPFLESSVAIIFGF